MVRQTAVVMSAFMLFVATQVFALGLGNITLDSTLNQPLRARIELLDLGNVNPANITIQLASTQDFERFNIDRVGFLSNLRFQIETTADGVFVNLSTTQIVREPYLSFILDTRWPSGRILSEHTVLLDLPVFNDRSRTEPVRQPLSPALEPLQVPVQRQSSVDQTPSPAPSLAEPEPVAIAEPEPQITAQVAPELLAEPIDRAAIPGTLETQNSDTLWDIALRVRPNSSVSVQQTMLAIQRLNPNAFVDGNINLLRSGQVLRIPDLSEIQSVDQQQAVSEVVRQNQQADIEIRPQPLTAPATGPSALSTGQSGQLSVITSDDAQVSDSGAGGALVEENTVLDARISALENQLALRQEDADRVRFEQGELISRLNNLDAQIASAMEIITLQDMQLAQLQAALAEAALQALLTDTPPAAQQRQASLLENILGAFRGNSMIMIAAAIVVVLLLVILMLRRNRATTNGFEDELDELVENKHNTESKAKAGAATAAGVTGASESLDQELDDILNIPDEYDELDTDDDADQSRQIPAEDDEDGESEELLAATSAAEEPANEDEKVETMADDDIDFDLDAFEIEVVGRGLQADEADDHIDFDLSDMAEEVDEPEPEPEVVTKPPPADEIADPFDFGLEDETDLEVAFELGGEDTAEAEEVIDVDDHTEFLEFSTEGLMDTGPEPVEEAAKVESFDFDLEDKTDETSVEFIDEDEDIDTDAIDIDLSEFKINSNPDDAGADVEEIEEIELSDDDENIVVEYLDDEEDASVEIAKVDKPEDQQPKVADDEIEENGLDFLSTEIEKTSATTKDYDENYDFLSGDDEAATKLELAYAYQKMGDVDGAREILEEVITEGNDAQTKEARDLLATLDNQDKVS